MLRQIQSVQHPLVKHLVKVRQIRDYRYDHGSCVVEGVKLVHELCKKMTPISILALREELLPQKYNSDTTYIVPEPVMNKASGLLHPEGLMAEFPLPPFKPLKGKRFILALDGINDPGNLGALLRSALAFGWEGVFLFNDTCDPFNEKAIRAAKGATFQLQLFQGEQEDLESLLHENKAQAVVADLEGTPFSDIQFPDGIVLVLGNEAHGPSKSIRQSSKKITIPMSGEMESLNVAVAGGILMQALRSGSSKQKGKNEKK